MTYSKLPPRGGLSVHPQRKHKEPLHILLSHMCTISTDAVPKKTKRYYLLMKKTCTCTLICSVRSRSAPVRSLCHFCKTALAGAAGSWRSRECPLEEFCLYCSSAQRTLHVRAAVWAEFCRESFLRIYHAKFHPCLDALFMHVVSNSEPKPVIRVRAGQVEV